MLESVQMFTESPGIVMQSTKNFVFDRDTVVKFSRRISAFIIMKLIGRGG